MLTVYGEKIINAGDDDPGDQAGDLAAYDFTNTSFKVTQNGIQTTQLIWRAVGTSSAY